MQRTIILGFSLLVATFRTGDTEISKVDPDPKNDRTVVRWSDQLKEVPDDPRVFALRLRASIFGFNARPPYLERWQWDPRQGRPRPE